MFEEDFVIYVDGSALTNPGSLVGCAGVIVYPKELNLPNKELKWPYSTGTSGSMEIFALVNALKWIEKNINHLQENEVGVALILSDSQYVVNAANKWVYRWSDPWNKNKWKTANGGTVKNQDLWKEYLRARKRLNQLRFEISIEWFKGKSTQETKRVDKLAKSAAQSAAKRPNFNQIPYKQGRFLLGKDSTLGLISEVGQTHLIRVGSHSMVGRKKSDDYQVRFEVIGNNSIEGRFLAYTDQATGFSSIDRGNYYYATFADNVEHPWIEKVEKIEGDELKSIKKRVKDILDGMKS